MSLVTAWFLSMNAAILIIHRQLYEGTRDSNRYRVGHFVFEVSGGSLKKIHNFKDKTTLAFYQDEIQYTGLDKVSSLAQDVTEYLPEAIRRISSKEVFEQCQKANRLNISWIESRYAALINYINTSIQ